MKIVVNSGRTVHKAVTAGSEKDGKAIRPQVKAYGPTHRLELPDDEAKFLIARGFVREDKPIKETEPEKPAK